MKHVMRAFWFASVAAGVYRLAKVASPSWLALVGLGLLVYGPALAAGWAWLRSQLYPGDTVARALVRWLRRGLR